ncbi:DNA glycosylase AlkZ-like family protein [Nocardia cyriacigeorgica]|uniref:DNA glycosylase AlkZ-like family protein n=1 Tax=Nocardia cyriacigeorgica TaxID=135487 RepID=UPI0018937DC1|nr:crosslink repair DNA glycosylase YcaQ family protein [Nocardia cyriacigeorgica]MBF6435535.1 winged helix DNA-binding domain-containing protein [Nocardia cyriacigeorgica]MBF6454386.1 winged helix DNA-binding domain-containing protein [Nocardia cyriacigeorgica]MBF6478323.1 winged helix DNA-binding domain-containing protein [Nocardia cyriacigeorgica]MBF6552280.1 winged helix DNA-binding domain-containing protein [Nocardia cyriacigeorgica]
MRVSWDQAFAWRLRRQYVRPRAAVGVVGIAARLCGLQAQVASSAELAAALRTTTPETGAVARALTAGELIKTWAMRGTLHAMTPDTAAACLTLLAAARTWEKPSWQRTFGATPAQVAALADKVGELLESQILTREELVEQIAADPAFAVHEAELRSGWGALLKPLAWQGVLCHGPARGTKVSFTSPSTLPGWRPVTDVDAAARTAVTAYLGAYGPATPEAFDAWLSRGAHRKTRVRGWFADLGEELTEVDVDGRRAYILTEHADELAATEPDDAVQLLGAFDQYVLGPGTGDPQLLPAEHRAKVSRTAGWIAPIVVARGRIAGTWELTDADEVVVAMFDGAAVPRAELAESLAHLAEATGRDRLTIRAS